MYACQLPVFATGEVIKNFVRALGEEIEGMEGELGGYNINA